MSVLPTVNSTTGEVRLYLSNFRRLDMSPIAAATITVHVSGTKLRNSTGHLIRLDDQSLTAVAAWQAMGAKEGTHRNVGTERLGRLRSLTLNHNSLCFPFSFNNWLVFVSFLQGAPTTRQQRRQRLS